MYIISIFNHFKIFKKTSTFLTTCRLSDEFLLENLTESETYIDDVLEFKKLWEIDNSFIKNKNTQQSTHKVA